MQELLDWMEYIEDVRQIFQNSYPGKDKKSLELNFEES